MKYGIFFICFLFISFNALGNLDAYYDKQLLEEQVEYKLKENKKFKESLGLRESSMRPNVINQIGAMGIWQFMPYTLSDLGLGHITPNKFRQNPDIFPIELQEYVLDLKIERDLKLLSHQWWRGERSKNYIDMYVGSNIYGVEVTLSGIIAACHIAGAGGVIRFFDTAGMYNPQDANKTSLLSYLREFSGHKFNYHSILQLNDSIECLNKLLNGTESGILSLKQSKLSLTEQPLRDMGIALTSVYPKGSYQNQQFQEYIKSHSGLRQHCLNTIEVYYAYEALHLLDTTIVCRQATEKLNGTILRNGKELYKHQKFVCLQRKELDYSNSLLNQYGMPPGTSKLWISFRYLGLRKLLNLTHLEVA